MTIRNSVLFIVIALVALVSPLRMTAQGATDQVLVHPPADSWPGYHGDYSGRRHTPLPRSHRRT